YGYSMGTGVASYVATQARPRALILEGPFTSFPDAVRRQVPSAPVWLVRSRFDNRARIRQIDAPILFLAGGKDTVTPPAFAETLAGLGKGFSLLQILPEATHLNMYRNGALDAVAAFLMAGTAQAQTAEPAEAL